MKQKGIKVLSLFDGMSCGRIALERAGIKIDKYYASEIDKSAMSVAKYNYNDTVFVGDVCLIKGSDFGKIDLIIGGSPCQGFSFAGKGLNFNDPRSKLFFEFVRLWKELKVINPKLKFMLENVEMKYEHELVISKTFGINPLVINAALVSAQNRVRNFWTDINSYPSGLFGNIECKINQPDDLGIVIKDIVQIDVDEKYYLSEKALSKMIIRGAKINPDKTHAVDTKNNNSGGGNIRSSSLVDVTKIDKKGNKKANQDKASCFTAGGNSGGNHSDMDLLQVHRKVIQINEAEELGKQPKNGNRVYDIDGISPSLMASQSGGSHKIIVHSSFPRTGGKKSGGTGPLKREDGKTYALDTQQSNRIQFNPIQIDSVYEGNPQSGRVYSEDGKSSTLCSGEGGGGRMSGGYYKIETRIRRLTPIECERLQGVSDDYTKFGQTDLKDQFVISDTQRYKMLGNGWNVDVITHIFKFLINENLHLHHERS